MIYILQNEKWREEFDFWYYNQSSDYFGYDVPNSHLLECYLAGRKAGEEDVAFWKEEYVRHAETMCRCQEQNERLRKALEKIAVYKQFPSEKIALNALFSEEKSE